MDTKEKTEAISYNRINWNIIYESIYKYVDLLLELVMHCLIDKWWQYPGLFGDSIMASVHGENM